MRGHSLEPCTRGPLRSESCGDTSYCQSPCLPAFGRWPVNVSEVNVVFILPSCWWGRGFLLDRGSWGPRQASTPLQTAGPLEKQ